MNPPLNNSLAPVDDPKIWRFLSLASLVAILVTTLLLLVLYRQSGISTVVEFGESANIAVAQTALHAVQSEITAYLEQVNSVPPGGKNAVPIPEGLASAVQSVMQNTEVVRIKIYGHHGLVVYSTKPSQIGDSGADNIGVTSALDAEIKSRLVYKDAFSVLYNSPTLDEEPEDANLIQTYLPVRDYHSGAVIGVFEIYTDVQQLVQRIEYSTLVTVIGVVVILGLLYVFLLVVIRRAGNVVIQQRELILDRNHTLELLSSRLLTAEEDAKRTITHKLEEDVVQVLSAVKMNVERTCEQLSEEHPSVQSIIIGKLVPELHRIIQDVRAMAMELHPSSLDDIGLVPTIEWISGEFRSIYPDLAIETNIAVGEEQIPKHLKIVIFRVLQELLGHVGKSTQTGALTVHLGTRGNQVILQLDAHSPTPLRSTLPNADPDRRPEDIASPRERTVLSGGDFSVNDNHGHGYSFRAAWNC